MEFTLDLELVALADEARGFAASHVADSELTEDSWLIGSSREFSLALGERGWLGMTWPESLGGGGRPPIERLIVFEALISAGAPVATSWFADRQIGPTLMQFGSAEQRDRFLPEIISGRSAWCIGMSEPDAGSDVASLRTRAEFIPAPPAPPASSAATTGMSDCRPSDGRRSEDGTWIVTGQKVWTSGAMDADWCYLIARTDPDAPPHEGLSEFVVDMSSPGIQVRPILDATGGSHFCEVHFDEVVVPNENLVGKLNGSFKQVMRQMEHERGGIDRLVSNHRLYKDSLPLADTSNASIRQQIARIETGYRIGRHLVLREVLGQAPKGFSAATKTFCTEFEQEVAEFCVRVSGADALLWNRVSRGLCYSPAYTIMGGTTNILRNIMAERMLGLPREPRVPRPEKTNA
ncbi:MAG TPA: acyl-CoA dehydrogenase family protein [Microthrixaceae bacterium]|nr:acyl-CoA dehydrogenase family protein [Microthrixaceae bacterium]